MEKQYDGQPPKTWFQILGIDPDEPTSEMKNEYRKMMVNFIKPNNIGKIIITSTSVDDSDECDFKQLWTK